MMGIQKTWQASYAFRKFREKTNQLSRIYWLQQMGLDLLESRMKTLKKEDFVVKEIPESTFDFRMYPYKLGEAQTDCSNFMDRNRLYLLVIYTAFLESYLKEITIFHLAAGGYLANPDEIDQSIRLNLVGKAIGAPILERSTVPDMIKYASQLFEIDFGKEAEEWAKIYKIRCEVAHNGGVATPNFLKQISGYILENDPKAYDLLGITWDELRKIMRISDDIAAKIDSKIHSKLIRDLEIDQILRELFVFKKLPHKNKVWQFLHENYGLRTGRVNKEALLKRFFR